MGQGIRPSRGGLGEALLGRVHPAQAQVGEAQVAANARPQGGAWTAPRPDSSTWMARVNWLVRA